MAMRSYHICRTPLLLLAAVIVGALSLPAQACVDSRSYSYDPERPFGEHYFQSAEIVFRGRPIEYRNPDPEVSANFLPGAEIMFEVLETYRGKENESWTAFWVNTMDVDPDSLQAFREEIGEDLVVILEGPNDETKLVTELPIIPFGLLCTPSAMGRFSVMESILQQRGFID